MRKLIPAIAVLVGIVLALMSSVAAGQPPVVNSGALTSPTGKTLYTFDNDVANSGNSMCVGTCSKAWPPLFATKGEQAQGDFGIIDRSDGTRQWTYKGKPLYMWADDKKAGDKGGDGYQKKWHVAKP